MKLLDTNIVIYLQKGMLQERLPPDHYAISVITEIELRSSAGLNHEERQWLMRFIGDVEVLDINHAIKEKAIQLRQSKKVKLPDAIIAATALTYQAELLTNDKDCTHWAGFRLERSTLFRMHNSMGRKE